MNTKEENNPFVSIGDKLKACREKKKLTQKQVADRVNGMGRSHVGKSDICKYEKGIAFPDMDTMIALCAIYEESLDYICLGRKSLTKIQINEIKDIISKVINILMVALKEIEVALKLL